VELYLHSPNTPPWRGAWLKKSTVANLPLLLHDIHTRYNKARAKCIRYIIVHDKNTPTVSLSASAETTKQCSNST
jgi:hypothetical protein